MFRFKVSWLRGDFKCQDKIDRMKDLSDKKREYLQAIHKQSSENLPLAKNPSVKDILVLNKAYGKEEYVHAVKHKQS